MIGIWAQANKQQIERVLRQRERDYVQKICSVDQLSPGARD
jgi:hypothetical protein